MSRTIPSEPRAMANTTLLPENVAAGRQLYAVGLRTGGA